MKKFLLSLAAVATMFSGMAAEASYTVEFITNDKDQTNSLTESAKTDAYILTGAEYVSGITEVANVYPKSIDGLKFSSTKNDGKITFALSDKGQVNATSVVVNARLFKESEKASLSVNGLSAQDLTADLDNYTFELGGGMIETITLAATKRLYVKSITVYYDESGVVIPSCELSYTSEEMIVKLGDEVENPLLNPFNVPVTYTSSNESVATVDAEGVVTTVGAGSTKITAVFEGNDSYRNGSASYTLTVVEGRWFVPVTELTDEMEVVLVADGKICKNLEEGKTYGYLASTKALIVDGKVCAGDDCVFTFKKSGDAYNIFDNLGQRYYMSGTYNTFNVQGDEHVVVDGDLWTVTFEGEDAKILNVEKNKFIQLSKSHNSFGAYLEMQAEGVLPVIYALYDETVAVEGVEAVSQAPAVYYDLNGRRVNGNLDKGLYIKVEGAKVTKILVK